MVKLKRQRALNLLFILLCLILISACGSKETVTPEQQNSSQVSGETQESGQKTEQTTEAAVKGNGEQQSAAQTPSSETDNPNADTSGQVHTDAHAADKTDNTQKNTSSSENSGSAKGTSSSEKTGSTEKKEQPTESLDKAPADKPASEESAQVHVVEIVKFAFSPSKLEIKAGDHVKFINKDEVRHSATADDDSFDTGLFGQDEEKEVIFSEDGEFTYYCSPHPAMQGTIIVSAN
jgi:plastocyanin